MKNDQHAGTYPTYKRAEEYRDFLRASGFNAEIYSKEVFEVWVIHNAD
jgi:hypothetical protein